MMRSLALAVVAATSLFAVQPAEAQTYSPDFPVCLHVYGPVTYYECRYTSLAQCNVSASGRAAQCEQNPYLASAGMGAPPVRYRRHRHHAY